MKGRHAEPDCVFRDTRNTQTPGRNKAHKTEAKVKTDDI